MGLPCFCNTIILPRPLAQLAQIICDIRFAIAIVFSYIGLQQPEIFLDHADHASHLLSFNNSTAAVCPAVAIKKRLPVVEYASLLIKRSQGALALRMPEEPTCMVCLGWLEAKDVVRELGNCCHAFHRDCIDRWVGMGHVTCPLCRSQLLKSRQKEMLSLIRWWNFGAIRFWNVGYNLRSWNCCMMCCWEI